MCMASIDAAPAIAPAAALDAFADLDAAPAALQAQADVTPKARRGRVAAGLAALTAALGLSLFFVVFTATSEAVVTGRVVALPTPIAGTVLELSGETGDSVVAGQVVARVRNERADGGRLETLRTQQAGLHARLTALRAEITHKAAERARLMREVDVHRDALIVDVEHQCREAQLRHASAAVLLEQRRSEAAAMAALFAAQLVSRLDHERAAAESTAAESACEEHQSASERLQGRLAALRRGVIGGADAPAEKLRAGDLALTLTGLELTVQELRQSLETVDHALEAEHAQVSRLSDAAIESPVRGRVWKRAANAGQFISAGGEVMELVEASSLQVEAYFHQRYLPDIAIGDAVRVMPVGSRAHLTGTVRWIGAEASASTRTVAPQWQPDQDKPMRVVVALNAPDRDRVFVGQRARVVVASAGIASTATTLFSWLLSW